MDFNYFDIAIIVIILITALIGFMRGLVWMGIFLATWTAAILLAIRFKDNIAQALEETDKKIDHYNFTYAEAEGLSGYLDINANEYWRFENGQSQFSPSLANRINTLKLVVDGYSVDYQIDVFSIEPVNNKCVFLFL